MSAGVLVAASAACLLGGVLPWISNEVVVAAAVPLLAPEWLPLLVVGASTGQLTAKTGLYALARWAPDRLPHRARSTLERARGLVPAHRGRSACLLLASAAVGMPPFYLATLAAGFARVPLALFLCAGGTGVLVRTCAVAGLAAGILTP